MEQVILCCLISKIGDWTIRVDSPHGSAAHSKKHVHITKKKLKGEYSWNIDGTRHDEHRFPATEKSIAKAKEHAASALGVPVSSLSFIVAEPGGARMSVRSNVPPQYQALPIFNAYIPVKLSLVVFGGPNGLVLVLQDDA